MLEGEIALRNPEAFLFLRMGITPPGPGRNPGEAGDLQDAIRRTPGIGADDHKLLAVRAHIKSFPDKTQGIRNGHRNTEAGQINALPVVLYNA